MKSLLLSFVVLMSCVLPLAAQPSVEPFETPGGTIVTLTEMWYWSWRPRVHFVVSHSATMVSITVVDTNGRYYPFLATLPDLVEEVSPLKMEQREAYCFVTLRNGTIYRVTVDLFDETVRVEHSTDPPSNFVISNKTITGDDMYLISTSAVAVTRDNGTSWQQDTAGLPAFVQINDFAFDSLQTLYLATSRGLFRQPRASNTWSEVAATSGTPLRDVHIDRQQRIWVYSLNGVNVSTDGGTTFMEGPSSLHDYYAHFTSDNSGNMYAALGSSPNGFDSVVYSAGGSAPFVRIDAELRKHFPEISGPYTSITAEDSLLIGTVAGIYTTSNFGVTWTHNSSLPARHVYDIYTSSHGDVVSTETGVYKRSNDTWSQVYPAIGFADGARLLAEPKTGSLYLKHNTIYKSTDGGESWIADSAGYSAVEGTLAIDNGGMLHALHSEYIPGVGSVARTWRRNGSTWVMDTNGLPGQLDSRYGVDVAGTDHNATGGLLLRVTNQSNGATTLYRSVAAGGWESLGEVSGLVFSASGNGGVLAATGARGVLVYSNGQWKYMNTPSDVNPNNLASVVAAVGTSGRIWSAFELFNPDDPGSGAIRKGVYYSDDQKTWTKVALDSVQISGIVPSADSAFVLTASNGAYLLHVGAASVLPAMSSSGGIRFVCDDESGMARLSLLDPTLAGEIDASISDIGGRVLRHMAVTLSEAAPAVTWDLKGLAAGMYLYTITTKSSVVSGKFLLR